MYGSTGNGKALLEIYRRGRLITSANAEQRGESLVRVVNLSGRHILLLSDVNNADVEATDIGRRCFTVSVE